MMRFEMIFLQIFDLKELTYLKSRRRTEGKNLPKSAQRSHLKNSGIGSWDKIIKIDEVGMMNKIKILRILLKPPAKRILFFFCTISRLNWKVLLFAVLAIAGSAFANEFWIRPEYLCWFIKENPLPVPLVASASYSNPLPGALGQPGTHVLLGRSEIGMGWMNGFQISAGSDAWSKMDMQGSYFFLPSVSSSRSLSTSGQPGSPNFSVPIFDVTGVLGLNGIPGETLFILPGPLEGMPGFFGTFQLRLSSQFQGAELDGLYSFVKKETFRFEGLFGFRWLQLKESLVFKANSGSVPNFPFEAGFFNFSDRFRTYNNLFAAQLGISAHYLSLKWELEAILKGGLGSAMQQVKIDGTTQTSGGNLFFTTHGTANETLPGGIFAQPTNAGSHRQSPFAGSVEAQIRSGYRITSHVEIDFGYSFLWISKFLRPGDQIDRKINSTLTALADASRETVGTGPGPIPFGTPSAAPSPRGPKRPAALFKTASFWAQGFDAGLQFNF